MVVEKPFYFLAAPGIESGTLGWYSSALTSRTTTTCLEVRDQFISFIAFIANSWVKMVVEKPLYFLAAPGIEPGTLGWYTSALTSSATTSCLAYVFIVCCLWYFLLIVYIINYPKSL